MLLKVVVEFWHHSRILQTHPVARSAKNQQIKFEVCKMTEIELLLLVHYRAHQVWGIES